MNRNQFEERVTSGSRDEYVGDEALSFMQSLPVVVEDSEYGDDRYGGRNQLWSVSLPEKNSFSDDELVSRVREKLAPGQGRDIQKMNVVQDGSVVTGLLVLSLKRGYSVVATFE